jgi:hypothetical protein
MCAASGLIIAVSGLILMSAPIIVRERTFFLDNVPTCFGRLKTLTSDPSRPLLHSLVGQGFGSAEKAVGELTSLVVEWFASVVRSVWYGGRALLSVYCTLSLCIASTPEPEGGARCVSSARRVLCFSLAIVAPVVAGYLLYDWNNMLATVDNWVPSERRPIVRAPAREIDDTIGGFVRARARSASF